MPESEFFASEQALVAAKATCTAACAELDAAVLAIEPEARAAAVAAHAVLSAGGANPVTAALAGGRLVDRDHLLAVSKAADAVAAGTDAIVAVGADPAHVAALAAAAAAHKPHADSLASAYARYAWSHA